MSMIRKTSPWLGVLFILGLAIQSGATECPREVLLEVTGPVDLRVDAAGMRTTLPDLDAVLGQYPQAELRYALDVAIKRHAQFKKFLLVRLPQNEEKTAFLKRISSLTSVRWAQSHHLLRSHFTPDDPDFDSQWGLQRVGAPAAWDVSRGAAAIPIAIIDTGCQMDHPDLVASFWTNAGEIPDNNIDDDNNGFIDDIHGWDFVDAPSFPSNGDYLVRDNDPSDENGHGTALAGICGAVMDNGIGVAGLAPECPLMILRAGNSDGYLQEDDVASAILYALDNGARVVNMSFGDTEASPMLEDVITYGVQGGLMFVAAAGNYGNTGVVYPAAFASVLCVGACDDNDARALFSSYGTSLDLLAPGTNIVSTLLDGQYGTSQGTSFSTAFASAAAGLVLSRHPGWDAAMVSSTLKGSCDDLPPAGWDAQSGQGILRADRALEVEEALLAEITEPTMGQGFATAETLQVIGTASGVYLDEFMVFAGIGENPAEWEMIQDVRNVQIINSVLANWIISEPLDTAYTIRLEARDIFDQVVDDRVVVYYDPSPPEISDISVVPILDGERPSYLLRFSTDDQTTGKISLQGLVGPITRTQSVALNYETTDHVALIGRDLDPNLYRYYLWVKNPTGLVDSTGYLDTLDLLQTSITTNNFVEMPPSSIPPGHLYEEATDLDGDGFLEVWQDTLDVNGSISDLRVWEATTGWAFADQGLDFGKQIPKSIGDSDADGKWELLTLYGGTSKIFEATAADVLPQPNNVIWSDSGNVWGMKLLDLDSTDGHGELLLSTDSLIEGQTRGIYQLWAHYPTAQNPTLIQSLVSPFGTTSNFLPPYCRVSDYDDDGKTDLLFGDYDGHLYIYEQQTDGSFEVSWMDSVPLLDTGEFLSDGDYNGDGKIEFAALAHTETVLPGEHLADTRYWALYVYQTTADNQYAPTDTLYFFGAENPSSFPSGISSGNVYGDAKAEILLCLYPDFYVAAWNSVSAKFAIIWYYPECRSNKAVVGDFNRNGVNEILFNSGMATRIFEAVGAWSYWPPPPLDFQASAGVDRVSLSWLPATGVDAFNIYRGASANLLELLDDVPDTQHTYTDFDVVLDSTYYYAVSTVDLSLPTPEGPSTVPQAATPNLPPTVVGDTAHFVFPSFVTVDFSEPMDVSILDASRYWIAENNLQPRSVASDLGGRRAVLTFDPVLADTTYRLFIHVLYDLQGSPLSTLNDTVRFTVTSEEHTLPYLLSAAGTNGLTTVVLVFSQPMNHDELVNKANYSITVDPASSITTPASIIINDAMVDSLVGNSTVSLLINPGTPLGAFGRIYRVTANNLHTPSGLVIDPAHNSATLNFYQNRLDNAFVFPNPYSAESGVPYVIFANLTPNAEIRVLTLSGILIKTIKTSDNISGGVSWNLKNERGEPVGSGVYLYYISGDGDTRWGKLAVVR